MDARDRKAILGEWGPGGEAALRATPRDRVMREAAERDLEDSPVKGRPLRQRLRNFRPSVEGYVVSLGGPRAYMLRLREIEELTAAHERELEALWRRLADEAAGDDEFARTWREELRRPRFGEVNDLIERHNAYYPTEARLPMDPRTRDFALVNGRPYRRRPLDAAWALERYPADLEAARAGSGTPSGA